MLRQKKHCCSVPPIIYREHFPCVDLVVYGKSICISQNPVSRFQWAKFIKSGAYFEDAVWNGNERERRKDMLGDRLLDEVDFDWSRGSEPVTNIDWFEAAAYCRWQGGRLPWSSEYEKLKEQEAIALALPKKRTGLLGWWNRNTAVRPSEPSNDRVLREWCGEWWNPVYKGPEVSSSAGQPLRRLCGDRREPVSERMLQHGRRRDVGFRVVLEKHRDSALRDHREKTTNEW